MLKRMQLRRYLLALLSSNEVPQDPECNQGFLFVNCDGKDAYVFDSPTHELFENAEGSYQFKKDSITVTFQITNENLTLSPTRVEATNLSFQIDIIANASDGHLRQNLLDEVQERILYRLFSYQEFTDRLTGEKLKSFMTWNTGNKLEISIRDDSEYNGSITVRQMSFTLDTSECIERTGCSDTPICFDFKEKIGGC